jgi:hypothetical protein
MQTRDKNRHSFQPAESDSIIARAKQQRAEALRRMLGSVFGR